MWIVNYERHLRFVLYKANNFESKHFLLAWAVYQWWAFCYLMSPMPVRSVSLCRAENGVVFLKGRRGMVLRPEDLRRLRCKRSSYSSRPL